MRYKQLTLSIALAIFSLNAWADEPPTGDADKGKEYFELCAGCHGASAEGNEERQAPRLAGQHEWYLRTQLKNFRSGTRGAAEGDASGALMRSMSLSLPDDQAVQDVVAYISSIK